MNRNEIWLFLAPGHLLSASGLSPLSSSRKAFGLGTATQASTYPWHPRQSCQCPRVRLVFCEPLSPDHTQLESYWQILSPQFFMGVLDSSVLWGPQHLLPGRALDYFKHLFQQSQNIHSWSKLKTDSNPYIKKHVLSPS